MAKRLDRPFKVEYVGVVDAQGNQWVELRTTKAFGYDPNAPDGESVYKAHGVVYTQGYLLSEDRAAELGAILAGVAIAPAGADVLVTDQPPDAAPAKGTMTPEPALDGAEPAPDVAVDVPVLAPEPAPIAGWLPPHRVAKRHAEEVAVAQLQEFPDALLELGEVSEVLK